MDGDGKAAVGRNVGFAGIRVDDQVDVGHERTGRWVDRAVRRKIGGEGHEDLRGRGGIGGVGVGKGHQTVRVRRAETAGVCDSARRKAGDRDRGLGHYFVGIGIHELEIVGKQDFERCVGLGGFNIADNLRIGRRRDPECLRCGFLPFRRGYRDQRFHGSVHVGRKFHHQCIGLRHGAGPGQGRCVVATDLDAAIPERGSLRQWSGKFNRDHGGERIIARRFGFRVVNISDRDVDSGVPRVDIVLRHRVHAQSDRRSRLAARAAILEHLDVGRGSKVDVLFIGDLERAGSLYQPVGGTREGVGGAVRFLCAACRERKAQRQFGGASGEIGPVGGGKVRRHREADCLVGGDDITNRVRVQRDRHRHRTVGGAGEDDIGCGIHLKPEIAAVDGIGEWGAIRPRRRQAFDHQHQLRQRFGAVDIGRLRCQQVRGQDWIGRAGGVGIGLILDQVVIGHGRVDGRIALGVDGQ